MPEPMMDDPDGARAFPDAASAVCAVPIRRRHRKRTIRFPIGDIAALKHAVIADRRVLPPQRAPRVHAADLHRDAS